MGRLHREASKVSQPPWTGMYCNLLDWCRIFFPQLIGHIETLRHHAIFQPISIAEEKPFPFAYHTNDDRNHSKELVTETEYHKRV